MIDLSLVKGVACLLAALAFQVAIWVIWWHRVPPWWSEIPSLAFCVMGYCWLRPSKVMPVNNPRLKKHGEWMEFSELVDSDDSFKPCPICGGQVIVAFPGGWIMPFPTEPYCQECETEFRMERRWLIDGFRIYGRQHGQKITVQDQP